MHVASCLTPRKVINKSTGELMFVPCGQCAACRNKYALQWIQRLNAEARCHKYVMFITLTYDRAHLPKLYFDFENQILANDPADHGEEPVLIDYSMDDDISRIKALRESNGDYIGYASRRDCQIFMKALRENIKRQHDKYFHQDLSHVLKYIVKDEQRKINQKIRYFLVSEYGGKYFRPHYHGILFFDSPVTCYYFGDILRKSWQKGNVDYSIVIDKATDYVAKYINGSYNLPKVYQNSALRPFSLCSRKPAVGVCSVPREEIEQIFYGAATTMRVYDGKEYVDVPLWRTLKNQLFPKCKSFGSLSHSDRVALYRLSLVFPYEQLCRIKFYRQPKTIIRSAHAVPDYSLRDLFRVCGDFKPTDICDYLPSSIACDYRRLFRYCGFDKPSSNGVYESFVSALNLSRRVCADAFRYRIPVYRYVELIEDYYRKCDYESLKENYKFQAAFTSEMGCDVRHLIHIDRCFALRVVEYLSEYLRYGVRDALFDEQLLTFGIDADKLDTPEKVDELVTYLDIHNCNEYVNYEFIHKKIARDSCKMKYLNEDYFHNQLSFNN